MTSISKNHCHLAKLTALELTLRPDLQLNPECSWLASLPAKRWRNAL